jgi:pimeloyl-ACP methyl ester carboxylesterase
MWKTPWIRIPLIIVLILLILLILVIIVLFVNHRIQLRNEADRFEPLGQRIELDDTTIHVYAQGEGDTTFVFLAGHGTSSPTLDFKPLWGPLSDNNRIVVVERPGYGWSEGTKEPRDIATLLSETRQALEQAGEEGTFVLVPHSMSGLEAIYWAQQYPDEVTAIIGLDPLVPAAVELLPEVPSSQLNLTYFISRIGLSRMMPDSELLAILPLLEGDVLTDNEQAMYRALFFRSSLTKPMLAELEYTQANAATIQQGQVPVDVPMYFFVSTQQDEQVPGWTDALTSYLSTITASDQMELDTTHYVHHAFASTILDEIERFLGTLDEA